MAVTKIKPIKSTLSKALDYIQNPDKTDGKTLVSSFGCSYETADIEAWIVAAFDKSSNSETIENPWESVISRKKTYHDIRVRGSSKNLRNFAEFAGVVCENWSDVTRVCRSLQINLRITLDGTCAISRKWAGNEKALKSQDFKAFYMVEISGIEPLTS